MGVLRPPKLKLSPPKPYQVVIGQGNYSWRPGVISLVGPTRIPIGGVVMAKNCMQTQDGVWSSRWGSLNYGQPFTGPCTGIVEYSILNGANKGNYVMIMDNGLLKSSKDGGAWTTLSAHVFNSTVPTKLLMWENKVLIVNGQDPFSYWDLGSSTLVTFSGLSTPAAPTSTLTTLTSGAYPLYYQVTSISANGETPASPVCTVNVNLQRDSWYQPGTSNISSTSPAVNLTWTQISGAIGYNIYLSDGVSGVSYYLGSVGQPTSGTTASFTDYGINAVNDFIQAPVADTTVAPKFNWIALSNNRLWATGDPNNPNRVYWAGTGNQYATAFSPFVGGGWVDILPGGIQQPTTVVEFRDGKGDPLTTVLLAEPSGYGSTYHIDLQSDQIGNTTIIVPVLLKAVGTFGTLSPYGVVETNQNIYFHCSIGGFFSNGSVPTLFNILATTEVSILVRSDVKAFTLGALSGLCGIEYDRKIFWSVPYQAAQNNRIFIYDLEKQNSNPYAFDFGVKQFCRYTDNSSVTHLLAIPMTGNNLIELNEQYTNDNGVAFQSILTTGIIHVSPDHIQFVHATYGYYEFSESQGNVTMSIAGTPLNESLQQLESFTESLGGANGNAGLDTFLMNAVSLSYGDVAPTTTTDPTTKDRIRINQLLNNWEMSVVSQDPNAKWTLDQFIMVGQYVPVADPNAWIIN